MTSNALRTRVLSGLALVALAACSNANGVVSTPSQNSISDRRLEAPAKAGKVTTKHVQLVIFENESYDQVIGSSQAPYITGLSKTWANMTQSFAITHPSEPNYLALFSGSTQGVSGDQCPVSFGVDNLASQLLAANITFRGYAESMPTKGFTGCQAVPDSLPSGYLYMRKHVPWADFTNIPSKDSLIYKKPFAKAPAQFVWITPNMCNDMHDCPISTGDTWASKNLPKLIQWDEKNDGVLILTFDENDGSPGNQIPTILIGNVKPGQYSQTVNHYNVLRTIEDLFGLSPLGSAASASPIKGVIK
ncbi:MAG TPA: alkaline phosphatase family protein [Candidatus Tumulicola sp.]|jgi:acid phosphatase